MSDTPRTEAFLAEHPDGFGMAPFCRQLEREVAELRSRLEMNGTPYDGIAARDETIRLLEKQVAGLRAWRDKAFQAHPNIDLDIAALEGHAQGTFQE